MEALHTYVYSSAFRGVELNAFAEASGCFNCGIPWCGPIRFWYDEEVKVAVNVDSF